MALIKCPECGKDVSTEAEICPHCGYTIKKKEEQHKEELKAEYPAPLEDKSWINYWKSRITKTKIGWSIAFVVTLIFQAIAIISAIKTEGNAYIVAAIFCGVFGVAAFVMFILWLSVLISVRVRVVQEDGYTILVYSCWHNALVIDGKVFDQGRNRYMHGKLPNGKPVNAGIAAWDGSIRVTFEDKK